MAAFANCIASALAQGQITQAQAQQLLNSWNQHWNAANAAGNANPQAAATAALAAQMADAAANRRAMAQGSAAAAARIRNYAQNYRSPNGNPNVFEAFMSLMENFGGGTVGWRQRAEARARETHGEVEQFLSEFRRSRLTGQRFNRPGVEDVVREMLGTATGSPEARAMAGAFDRSFERLRQEFNNAAGFQAIEKLQGGHVPQFHDPAALLSSKLGKTADDKFRSWFNAELPRLDLNRMLDPLSGTPLSGATPARVEELARAAWEKIVTGGWSHKNPTAAPMGIGALASQRSDHRFFHYKSADDWLASDRDFGGGDPTKVMFNHINGMSHDIAAMETFGPNPGATLEWMKQVVQSEVAKDLTGKPSLHGGRANEDTGGVLANKLQSMFDAVRGPSVVSGRVASGFADVSNLLTSAYLGVTSILAAATDPFIDVAARRLNGLPWVRALPGLMHGIVEQFAPGKSRELAVRLGLGLDDFMHIMGNEARFAGMLGGHEWSKWLADRTVNLNGLEAITQARKHRFGIDFTAMAADHAGDSWTQLTTSNPYFRRTMENYGFTERDWNTLRATPQHIPAPGSAGYLSPRLVTDRDLSLRYLGMVLGETERAVPTSTRRSRMLVSQNVQRGTVWGEIINSGLQFKSFTLSFTSLQWQAMKMELQQGTARGAGYAASLMIPLTMGGAMAVQINNVINGKDMQPMDPTTGQGLKFWLQAMFKGGGLGIIGDFMFNDLTQFGHSPGEALTGPTIGLASDSMKLTVGNLQKALQGKKTHFGREAVRMAARNVPVISTLPYTRAAYQRMVIDQLQYLTDPEAHKYFRQQQQKMKSETGQGYWWRPGETSPDRMPELSDARR